MINNVSVSSKAFTAIKALPFVDTTAGWYSLVEGLVRSRNRINECMQYVQLTCLSEDKLMFVC